MRLRESVPLGEGKPAGVIMVDRQGGQRFLEPNKNNSSKIGHVGSLVAAERAAI